MTERDCDCWKRTWLRNRLNIKMIERFEGGTVEWEGVRGMEVVNNGVDFKIERDVEGVSPVWALFPSFPVIFQLLDKYSQPLSIANSLDRVKWGTATSKLKNMIKIMANDELLVIKKNKCIKRIQLKYVYGWISTHGR